MAWRIEDSIVRGEIDNRLPGIIKGTLYLEGLKSPVSLELEGDCEPDLAGRHLTFRNLLPALTKDFEGFGVLQSGEAGTLTANRMVRIPTISDEEVHRCMQERKPIPTRWSESLYLEWFSTNGRVVIEGSSFACQLSPPKWKLTDEGHQWSRHLAGQLAWNDSSEDEGREESGVDESMTGQRGSRGPLALSISTVGALQPHPIVKRVSEFLLQMIGQSKSRKFYRDEALENQPLEGMFQATTRATIRLAHAMAKATEHPGRLESEAIVQGLRRARWSLAEASDHAGLAKHMCSAAPEWLQGLHRDFAQLRREIRGLILEYQDCANNSSAATSVSPTNSANEENEERNMASRNYVTLSDDEKLKLLQEHSFQAPFPTLDQKNWCLHCEREFDGGSVRVWRDAAGEHWLECGTPECDGSPIDWAPFPWWDKEHPLTKLQKSESGQEQAPDTA